MNLKKLHNTSWKEEILLITDDSVRVRANFNEGSVIYNISRHPTFRQPNPSEETNSPQNANNHNSHGKIEDI